MKKTALITGAASGIGLELAYLLARDSYALILVDIDQLRLDDLKNRLDRLYNCRVTIITQDLSLPNCAQVIIDKTKNVCIDILINNAGFGIFGTFSETNWQRESDMLYVHMHTTTHLTKLVLKGMLERNSGKIMNVSSLAAFQPGPLMSIYYATKSYILSFSEAIANELKGTGVSLTVLCPGQTRTSFQNTVSRTSSNNRIRFNMACPKYVALYGYKALLKGKTIAIPGTFNKILASLHRVMPRHVTTHLVRKLQEKNRTTASP